MVHNLLADTDYYIVEMYEIPDRVVDWLHEKCGNRWFMRSNKIYFANSNDHLMFILRWA
jgi:hypothetical protein